MSSDQEDNTMDDNFPHPDDHPSSGTATLATSKTAASSTANKEAAAKGAIKVAAKKAAAKKSVVDNAVEDVVSPRRRQSPAASRTGHSGAASPPASSTPYFLVTLKR